MEIPSSNVYFWCPNSNNFLPICAENLCGRPLTVQCVLETVKKQITNFEYGEDRVEIFDMKKEFGKIITIGDVMHLILSKSRFRQRSIFVGLQLSCANGGQLRLTTFITNLEIPSSVSFGTSPDNELARNVINNVLRNISGVNSAVNALVTKYTEIFGKSSIKFSEDVLVTNMILPKIKV